MSPSCELRVTARSVRGSAVLRVVRESPPRGLQRGSTIPNRYTSHNAILLATGRKVTLSNPASTSHGVVREVRRIQRIAALFTQPPHRGAVCKQQWPKVRCARHCAIPELLCSSAAPARECSSTPRAKSCNSALRHPLRSVCYNTALRSRTAAASCGPRRHR